jgi:hypothetical protein
MDSRGTPARPRSVDGIQSKGQSLLDSAGMKIDMAAARRTIWNATDAQHVCNTGHARRTWLRGTEDVQKRYLVTLAGRNLTVLMRVLFGIGTPRSLQGLAAAAFAAIRALVLALSKLHTILRRALVSFVDHPRQWLRALRRAPISSETLASSTDS